MLRWILLLSCVIASAVSGRAAVTNLVELRGHLARALSTAGPGGTLWGVKVSSLRTGRTWFETNAASRMVPASNTKLFTAALALDRLGSERRLMTSLQTTNSPDDRGRLAGSLRIVGGGDPTFCARLHGGSWEQTWAPLVQAVQAARIRRVDGDLLCDERGFVGPPYGSGWNWDDLAEGYGAAVSALSAGDNVVSVVITPGATVGAPATARLNPPLNILLLDLAVGTSASSVAANVTLHRLPGESRLHLRGTVPLESAPLILDASVPSPALWFGMLFRDALEKAGVTVAGGVRVVDSADLVREAKDGAQWREIGAVASPPIRDLVREMMKPSQNLYAQLLWLAVGAEAAPAKRREGSDPVLETTEEAGTRSLEGFLSAAGIGLSEVRLEEGSGLSRKNLITPQATVQLLIYMARHRFAGVWRESLPVGGVDGTLRLRFIQPGLKGNVRAKTGTLRHVNALSGYVTNSVGEPLAFSILANNAISGGSARELTDTLVELLALSAVRDN